jgi:hypothetical protein
MSSVKAEEDESALLIAFARAASKAQEIEALFQEILIAIKIAQDARSHSFEDVVAQFEKPLGVLTARYLEILKTHIDDPQFTKMWAEVNDERIFLMHKFFNVFPLTSTNAKKRGEAAPRLAKIDVLLDRARRFLKNLRDGGCASLNITPAKFSEFLRYVIEERKKEKGGPFPGSD